MIYSLDQSRIDCLYGPLMFDSFDIWNYNSPFLWLFFYGDFYICAPAVGFIYCKRELKNQSKDTNPLVLIKRDNLPKV